MEVTVVCILGKFFSLVVFVLCLLRFQSMFTKIMFTNVAVLCSSDTMPEPAEHVEVDHTDRMALLVEAATA